MLMERLAAMNNMDENSSAVQNCAIIPSSLSEEAPGIFSSYISQSNTSQTVPKLKLKETHKNHKIITNCNKLEHSTNKMANVELNIMNDHKTLNRWNLHKECEGDKSVKYIHHDNDNKNNTQMMEYDKYIQELDAAYFERCRALDEREMKREREYKYKLEQHKWKMNEEIKKSVSSKEYKELEEKLEMYRESELNEVVEHVAAQWELLVEQTQQILEHKNVEVEEKMRNARLSNDALQSEIHKLQRELRECEMLLNSHTSRHDEEVSKLTEECVKAQSEITLLQAEMSMKDSQIKSLLMEMEVKHEEFAKYKAKIIEEYECKAQERISVEEHSMELEHKSKMSKLNEWQNQLTEYAVMLEVEHKAAFAKINQEQQQEEEELCSRVKMQLEVLHQNACTLTNNVVITHVEQMHNDFLQLRYDEWTAFKHLLHVNLKFNYNTNNYNINDKSYKEGEQSFSANKSRDDDIALEMHSFNERVVEEMYTNYQIELQKWFAAELQTQNKQAAKFLQQTRDEYEARLQDVWNENTRLKEECERVSSEQADTIATLKEEHNATMVNMKNDYELQIESILSDAAAKEKECVSQYELQLTECSDTYDVQLREAKARFAKELHDKSTELATQHAAQIAELQRNYECELEELTNELHSHYHKLIKEEKEKWWQQQKQQQQRIKENANYNTKVCEITRESSQTDNVLRESQQQEIKEEEGYINRDNDPDCELEEITTNNNEENNANVKTAPVHDELERAIHYIRELWNLLHTPQNAQDAFLTSLRSASANDKKANETLIMSLIYKELAKREAELKIAELYTRRDYCTFQLNELADCNTCNVNNRRNTNDNKENAFSSSKIIKSSETVPHVENREELQDEIVNLDARITRALHEYENSYNEAYVHQRREKREYKYTKSHY